MKSVLKANKENFNYLIRHFWPLITEIDYINHVETNKCGECISFPICGGTSCPAYRIKNGKYAKKCTPTMYCIDDLIKLNYEMMVEGINQ